MRASIAVLFMMLASPSLAVGNNEPWILSANNWQQAEDLLPTPVLERIDRPAIQLRVASGSQFLRFCKAGPIEAMTERDERHGAEQRSAA